MENKTEKRDIRFTDLSLSKDILAGLKKLSFTTPTPIQEKAIPLALEKKDVIGIAQTGTGKTFAFTLPMLQNIAKSDKTGLIIVPTRELAYQVQEQVDLIGRKLNFHSVLLIGGANMGQQIKRLKRRPDIIIATPGRLIDHLDRRTVKLQNVAVLVLDEADRMLDMGFTPQINRVLQSVPDKRQTLLFSATMPESVMDIVHQYMNNPVRIEVAKAGTSAKNVDQKMAFIKQENKFDLLKHLLSEYNDGPVLVFCRTKHGTKKMAHVLSKQKFRTEELHSNRSLNQRRRALENFKKGKSRVMIATDVAARGIDVKEIQLVINYDLPDSNEDYVHRIGRTGRASHKGHAISFATPKQWRDVQDIEKIVKKEIPLFVSEETLTEEEVEQLKTRRRGGSDGSRGGSRNRSRRRGSFRGGRSEGNRGGNRNRRGGRSNSQKQFSGKGRNSKKSASKARS